MMLRGRCVYFTGHLILDGYGLINRTTAHRDAWIKAHGPIPGDMDVMHLCDVLYAPGDVRYRMCVNLEHLRLVTTSDNVRHMVMTGRSGLAKVKPAQVEEIRQLWATGKYLQREIGAMYNLTQPMISLIVRGKSWL